MFWCLKIKALVEHFFSFKVEQGYGLWCLFLLFGILKRVGTFPLTCLRKAKNAFFLNLFVNASPALAKYQFYNKIKYLQVKVKAQESNGTRTSQVSKFK